MLEVEVLEFGYSVEHQKYFIKFNIKGMEKEKKDKMLPMLMNMPLENIKRFAVESGDVNSLKIIEYFPEDEYPFNDEVPSEEEVKAVEEMIKGFII